MTLRDILLARPNALNLLRLALAALVIVSHAWPLAGHVASPLVGGQALGTWAVSGFFCLSGFLIARSRMRLGFFRYLWHRSVRIFPGVWVCLLVVAFVFAPLSLLSGGSWSPLDGLTYVLHNAKLWPMDYPIPGTVGGEAWNGSLWTLFYEFCAYVVAGLVLTGVLRRFPAAVTGAMVLGAMVVVPWAHGPGEVTTQLVLRGSELGSYFVAGMFLYFVSDWLPASPAIAAAASGLLVVAGWLEWGLALYPVPLAYLLLWLGGSIPAQWSPRRTDISYGVYVYAFPVQVMLEWFVPQLPLTVHAVVAFLLVVPLALASWRVVEAPALRLKDVGVIAGPASREGVKGTGSSVPARHR